MIEMAVAHRTRARRGEGALLREELLTAADALLIETASEEAVSIRAIAERVGVTPPSIYRHFADKDQLLFAVCERTFRQLDDAMEQAADGLDDPFDALVVRGITYVRFGLDHPEHYRVLFMSHVKDHPAEVVDDRLSSEAIQGSEAFNHLVDAAARVLGRKRRPSAIELASEIWAFVHGLTSLRITFPTMPWPPVEDQISSYTSGLRARFER
jgi:AcrR family transcriptional regulator